VRSDGQSNSKDGAVADRALRFDQAAMHIHDQRARPRPEPPGSAASLIATVEPFEDVRQVFVADADSASAA